MHISNPFLPLRVLILRAFGMTGLYCSSFRVEEREVAVNKEDLRLHTLQFKVTQILLRKLISQLKATEKT